MGKVKDSMSKMVAWRTAQYSDSSIPQDTDSFFYGADIVRYVKFTASFSVKYCLAETLCYNKGTQHIAVPAGAYYLVNRGEEMECLPTRPNGQVLFVYFTDALLSDLQRNRRFPDTALLDDPFAAEMPACFMEHVYRRPDRLSACLQQLAHFLRQSEAPLRLLGPDIFYTVAAQVLATQRDVFQQIQRLHACQRSTREELYRRMVLAQDFMQDHWQENLSVAQVARQACLSPFHFHRRFREAFGQSPGEWFRAIKLEKARALLASGRLTVTQVALSCGFADVFSFSKTYKRVYGVSPSGLVKRLHPLSFPA